VPGFDNDKTEMKRAIKMHLMELKVDPLNLRLSDVRENVLHIDDLTFD
jgi:hypothetical protein